MRALATTPEDQPRLPQSPAPHAPEAKIAGYLAMIAPAYAMRTLDCLASDWRLFSAWCRLRSVWNKAKSEFAQTAGSVNLSALQALLASLAAKQLDL